MEPETGLELTGAAEPGERVAGAEGVVEGVPTGVVFAEPAAPPAPPPPPPVHVGGDIRPPRKLVHVPPIYPVVALQARIEGVVVIEAIIGPDGTVQDARVTRSIPLLDEAALAAVRDWRYAPTMLNGVPVAVIVTVTVQFSLR